MKRVVRWGVCGSGGIARRRTIPEGISRAANGRLVAVHGIHRDVNQEVAREYGATAVDSLHELLSMDIDAVYIATPANVHREQAMAAMQAGKHVLCEKPLGMTVAEAEEMSAAAARLGLRLGTALMMRFHAQHRAARDLIAAGRIGTPVYARAQLSCWYPPLEGAWRQDPRTGGGGSLIDMGGHCLDLLEMLLGPVASVSCVVRNTVHAYPSEDSAVALLQFTSGALGTVDTFFCIPDESSLNVLEVYGSSGSIIASGNIGQGDAGRMLLRRQGSAGYDAAQGRAAGGEVHVAPDAANTYRAEIEDFGDAILHGREPVTGGGAGLRSQKVLAACYQSARTGMVVSVAP
jgi:predicted dehydrogenase